MLFTVTQEMHTWAVKPKQHCTMGGEGDEFVPFEHDGCMTEIENCIEMPQHLSGVVDKTCPGLWWFRRAVFNGSTKSSFKIFFNLSNVRGRIYCFFNNCLILLGNRSRSESMRGFN